MIGGDHQAFHQIVVAHEPGDFQVKDEDRWRLHLIGKVAAKRIAYDHRDPIDKRCWYSLKGYNR